VPTKAETQGETDRAVAEFLKGRKREDVVWQLKLLEMLKGLRG